ncbi:TIGR04282 family arsenosugar biosynthesis glycosyltransferase [Blastochloris viridis]|uniref:Glycosyltransferase n=1 Tax=Blastochloris viridis TaxID=1079 RepID=A0A0H5BPQ1_BLAVI|nr:TIGR04282 family arsenosugar biosynthesis glycosyltransferase [Blastochloris viridis]ALK10382.1 2-phospho-L-lactate guanylyltransferase [Blastochloris viridis]BAR99678.1 glycosyltransferase [Blastochloris viridis]CUU43044.1 hypothetical protein BVIRIDIS_20610 [Blastochloris viridis]
MAAESSVAIAVMAKVPAPGRAKTRLCPPLTPDQAAALAAAFLADIAERVAALAARIDAAAYVAYTPRADAVVLDALVPPGIGLVVQPAGDLGARMAGVAAELMRRGHRGVVLLGADAPTLPGAIVEQAAAAAAVPGRVAMAPMLDGGYGVLALDRPHGALFDAMPWSTGAVAKLTRRRARAAGIDLIELPGWYDVDDAPSLALLAAEFAGSPLPLGHGLPGADAARTRALVWTLSQIVQSGTDE